MVPLKSGSLANGLPETLLVDVVIHMAGEAEIGPYRIGEKSEAALARFEITHERGEQVALLGDLDEALIDIDGVAARGDIAVDAGEPAIGREAEFPGIDRRDGST